MTKQETILPFQALRYNLTSIDNLADVIAPPYDVIGPEQQKALYDKSAYNIAWLDVTQEGSGQPTEQRYAKAASDYQAWQDKGVLARDPQTGIYVYEQIFTAPDGQRFTRRGFYALRRLEAFGAGKVFPHEKTLAGPKKDRLALMKATSTQMSPIFALFRDESGAAAQLMKQAVETNPLFDIKDDSGQQHRLWQVTDQTWIQSLQNAVQDSPFLIADGHHRYETALAYAQWRKDNQPNELAGYVLMFCEEVEDPGLLVLPTHRVAHHRPDFSAGDFLAKVRDFFAVEELTDISDEDWFDRVSQSAAANKHVFGISLQGDTKRYIASIESTQLNQIPALQIVDEPLKSLDAAILHKVFLESFLGYTALDQENTDYINYMKSGKDFLKRIHEPDAQVGIIMNASPLAQIRTVAEAGQFMPPKTTYFYPKLPTGLVINLID